MKKKTVRCHDVLNHICEELDTKLTTAKCRALKQHMEQCPNCNAYLDSLKKTVLLYNRHPDPHLPAVTREKLFAILKINPEKPLQ